MKLVSSFAALSAALSLATAVSAREEPADPGFETRLALAHHLVEVSGGRAQAEKMLAAIYGSTSAFIPRDAPPETQRLLSALTKDMQDEMIGEIPNILDISARVHAQTLTEKELRDEIAWLESDSGRSIRAKTPEIARLMTENMGPMMQAMAPRLVRKVQDRVCEEVQCTANDRKLLAAVLEKAMPGSGAAKGDVSKD